MCAVALFEKHVEDKEVECLYLGGIFHMLSMVAPDEDTPLSAAVSSTLGLVDDGAEWDMRLRLARQELRDLGVKV
jgi:hypothetical protein